MSVTGVIQGRTEKYKIDWKRIAGRNRRERAWFADRKQKGFLKIWLGIAVPVIALATVVGILALGTYLVAFICLEQLTAIENAMQAADLFSTYDVSAWAEECAEWLQLDRFNIVAVVI